MLLADMGARHQSRALPAIRRAACRRQGNDSAFNAVNFGGKLGNHRPRYREAPQRLRGSPARRHPRRKPSARVMSATGSITKRQRDNPRLIYASIPHGQTGPRAAKGGST
jgi:hypothetical protein